MAPPITCSCGQCEKCKRRVYMRTWYRKNAERHRETARQSRLRRIEKVRAYDNARGYRSDPLKSRARKAVAIAVASGALGRGSCVVGQDCRGRIEGHHEDYTRPLEVTWICQKHHAELHRRVAA